MNPVIPPKSNRKEKRDYDRALYKLRHLVENGFLEFKQWRGVATRYAKNSLSYLDFTQNPGKVMVADTAATLASVAAYRGELEPEQLPVAVSISSQIVANIREGLLVAEATIPHPGRTLMAASTRVTDGDGRLLALVNSTHFVRPGAA